VSRLKALTRDSQTVYVLRVLQDPLVLRGLKKNPQEEEGEGLQGHRGLLDPKEKWDHKDFQGLKELLELMDPLGLWGLLDHKEKWDHKDLQGMMELPDQWELQEMKDLKGNADHKGLMDRKEKLGLLGQ